MTRSDEIYVYPDESGQWRWRKIAANGEIVADSAESYTRKADALEAAEREAQTRPVDITEQDLTA
jgi:uncharacterized protein YegP (UPF0339 family)